MRYAYAICSPSPHPLPLPPHLVTYQVNLVQQNAVRVGNLLHRLVHDALALVLVEVLGHMICVNHSHHAIQTHPESVE